MYGTLVVFFSISLSRSLRHRSHSRRVSGARVTVSFVAPSSQPPIYAYMCAFVRSFVCCFFFAVALCGVLPSHLPLSLFLCRNFEARHCVYMRARTCVHRVRAAFSRAERGIRAGGVSLGTGVGGGAMPGRELSQSDGRKKEREGERERERASRRHRDRGAALVLIGPGHTIFTIRRHGHLATGRRSYLMAYVQIEL